LTRDNLLDDIRNFGATSRLKVCHMFFFVLVIIPIVIDFSHDRNDHHYPK
jgi:hypothetical protein